MRRVQTTSWRRMTFGGAMLVLLVAVIMSSSPLTERIPILTRDDMKLVTGFLLGAVILHQWSLHLYRHHPNRPMPLRSLLTMHRRAGYLLPVLLVFHTDRWGYGIIRILMLVFLANVILGLVSPDTIRIRSAGYYSIWVILHVALSTIILGLLALHLYQVFWFDSPWDFWGFWN